MDDVLPLLLFIIGAVLLLLAGLTLYALSFLMPLNLAIYIVLGAVSSILCPLIFWLIPNVDNKDAIIAMRIIIILAFFSGLAILVDNLIKAFAIK